MLFFTLHKGAHAEKRDPFPEAHVSEFGCVQRSPISAEKEAQKGARSRVVEEAGGPLCCARLVMCPKSAGGDQVVWSDLIFHTVPRHLRMSPKTRRVVYQVDQGEVQMSSFEKEFGRIMYVAGALEYESPFLGLSTPVPLFAESPATFCSSSRTCRSRLGMQALFLRDNLTLRDHGARVDGQACDDRAGVQAILAFGSSASSVATG